ncbi:MAG: RsmD family RNA methyltransferase [Bacteriovoracaceae bacterium]|nr:RsmD family RNA methyltransferase [Bacteriovoracaceae bacterium]
MSLKILGGRAKGHFLHSPPESTRPTSVLLKRRIFDSVQDLSGFCFVDLFAGSGSIGLEALSRGAESVYLIEKNSSVYKVLLKNKDLMEKLLPLQVVNSYIGSALSFLQKKFDVHLAEKEDVIIYIDPPYAEHDLYGEVLSFLQEKKFKGCVWLESESKKGLSLELLKQNSDWALGKSFGQGSNFIVMMFLSPEIKNGN